MNYDIIEESDYDCCASAKQQVDRLERAYMRANKEHELDNVLKKDCQFYYYVAIFTGLVALGSVALIAINLSKWSQGEFLADDTFAPCALAGFYAIMAGPFSISSYNHYIALRNKLAERSGTNVLIKKIESADISEKDYDKDMGGR